MISRTNLLLSGTYVLGCCSNELLRTNSHQPHLSLTNPTSLSLSLSQLALSPSRTGRKPETSST